MFKMSKNVKRTVVAEDPSKVWRIVTVSDPVKSSEVIVGVPEDALLAMNPMPITPAALGDTVGVVSVPDAFD